MAYTPAHRLQAICNELAALPDELNALSSEFATDPGDAAALAKEITIFMNMVEGLRARVSTTLETYLPLLETHHVTVLKRCEQEMRRLAYKRDAALKLYTLFEAQRQTSWRPVAYPTTRFVALIDRYRRGLREVSNIRQPRDG